MDPALSNQSLPSNRKVADAGYISICDDKGVNIYYGRTARIIVSESAVLKEWKYLCTKLWRVPLHPCVTNLNTHTLLLDGTTGTESLNSIYSVPLRTKMLSHPEVFNQIRPSAVKSINNVYEIPSIEPADEYLHGTAGFPTKATWIRSIQKGNYLTWTLINVKNVNKCFPESEETQIVHMQNQRQGVWYTKKPNSATDLNNSEIIELPTIDKRKDIYIVSLGF